MHKSRPVLQPFSIPLAIVSVLAWGLLFSELHGQGITIKTIDFSPSTNLIAIGDYARNIRIFSADTLTEIATFPGPQISLSSMSDYFAVNDVAFSTYPRNQMGLEKSGVTREIGVAKQANSTSTP
jgi:hypothetical protein